MVFLALHSGMLAGFTGRVSSSVSLGSCFSGLMCKGRTCEWPFLVSFDVPWYGIPCTYFIHCPWPRGILHVPIWLYLEEPYRSSKAHTFKVTSQQYPRDYLRIIKHRQRKAPVIHSHGICTAV